MCDVGVARSEVDRRESWGAFWSVRLIAGSIARRTRGIAKAGMALSEREAPASWARCDPHGLRSADCSSVRAKSVANDALISSAERPFRSRLERTTAETVVTRGWPR